MIEAVEERNNQIVDWETGEELFRLSDCIPMSVFKSFKKEIEKRGKDEWDSIPTSYIEKLDTLEELLAYYKEHKHDKKTK